MIRILFDTFLRETEGRFIFFLKCRPITTIYIDKPPRRFQRFTIYMFYTIDAAMRYRPNCSISMAYFIVIAFQDPHYSFIKYDRYHSGLLHMQWVRVRACLDIFSLICHFCLLSPSLWETAQYRLKYCLKGPLNQNRPTKMRRRRCKWPLLISNILNFSCV